jgi:DNA-directed RNA polymerase II subunit RPB1
MEKDNVHNIYYSQKSGKNSCKGEIQSMPWLVRIRLNREKMMNKDIKLLDIKSKFCSHWDRRSQELKGVKKEDRVLLEKISQVAVLTNGDSDPTPIVHIRFDMTEFNFITITSFINNIIDRFKLKGLTGIDGTDVLLNDKEIIFNDKNGEIDNDFQHVIFTNGVNMLDIRYLNGIDLNKTVTNDIKKVYEIFGIEAARSVLIKEMKYTFAASDTNFNFQHMAVLVDIMTHNGFLVSIDRHGMTKIDTDPLSRASFEKTVDQLFNAAVFGEVDHMRSVSARIMAGMAIKGGTGLPDIILDTDMLENSEYIEELDEYSKKGLQLTTTAIIDDIINEEEDEGEGGFMPVD